MPILLLMQNALLLQKHQSRKAWVFAHHFLKLLDDSVLIILLPFFAAPFRRSNTRSAKDGIRDLEPFILDVTIITISTNSAKKSTTHKHPTHSTATLDRSCLRLLVDFTKALPTLKTCPTQKTLQSLLPHNERTTFHN